MIPSFRASLSQKLELEKLFGKQEDFDVFAANLDLSQCRLIFLNAVHEIFFKLPNPVIPEGFFKDKIASKSPICKILALPTQEVQKVYPTIFSECPSCSSNSMTLELFRDIAFAENETVRSLIRHPLSNQMWKALFENYDFYASGQTVSLKDLLKEKELEEINALESLLIHESLPSLVASVIRQYTEIFV